MSNPKTPPSIQIIPKDAFLVCKLDGLSLKEIGRLYTRADLGKAAVYALDKFAFHLQVKHGVTMKDYIIQYLGFTWPICPVSHEETGCRIGGEGVRISMFKRGSVRREFVPALDDGYRRLADQRKGEGNPMHGRAAWCRGLTSETDERLRIRGERQRGSRASQETRAKQRVARAEHPAKARHTTPHSPATRELLRASTARLWAEGIFNRTTSIHLKMREFLTTLPLSEPVREEYQVKYFSMDFAFPEQKVAIECQGSYFHIDPRIYPNGPINAMQRRNFGRDKAKRKICCDQEGWTIIEAWEPEINDGSFKTTIECELKRLGLLKD